MILFFGCFYRYMYIYIVWNIIAQRDQSQNQDQNYEGGSFLSLSLMGCVIV